MTTSSRSLRAVMMVTQRFKNEHPDDAMADSFFDEFAGTGGQHVDPDPIKADLAALRRAAASLEAFADKTIAHLDKSTISGSSPTATFDDLDRCLDLLEELTLKYYRLFTALSVPEILPTYQYDWTQIFREPWIIDEQDWTARFRPGAT